MYNYKIDINYDINGDDDTNYKSAFLSVMYLKSYDGKKIMKVFDYLFDEIEKNPFFEHLFTKKYNIPIIGNNKKDIIPILFSYQSFLYMHKCLQSYFETKSVNEKDMKDLDESLNYLVEK